MSLVLSYLITRTLQSTEEKMFPCEQIRNARKNGDPEEALNLIKSYVTPAIDNPEIIFELYHTKRLCRQFKKQNLVTEANNLIVTAGNYVTKQSESCLEVYPEILFALLRIARQFRDRRTMRVCEDVLMGSFFSSPLYPRILSSLVADEAAITKKMTENKLEEWRSCIEHAIFLAGRECGLLLLCYFVARKQYKIDEAESLRREIEAILVWQDLPAQMICSVFYRLQKGEVKKALGITDRYCVTQVRLPLDRVISMRQEGSLLRSGSALSKFGGSVPVDGVAGRVVNWGGKRKEHAK